jgi:hypothetical protein
MKHKDTNYAEKYRGIDFRKHPEKYVVGKGEQGVLIAEPYKSEILPHWRFKDTPTARSSAREIYELYQNYKRRNDFVGMDMARKFLQMGFTRARRYANHKSGRKYAKDGSVKPQEKDWNTSEKAQAASVFFEYYYKVNNDPEYVRAKQHHAH